MQLDIDSIFSHHPPANEETAELHAWIRLELKDVAQSFQAVLPDSPEKTLAIRRLQEAMMYANAAVAQHGI